MFPTSTASPVLPTAPPAPRRRCLSIVTLCIQSIFLSVVYIVFVYAVRWSLTRRLSRQCVSSLGTTSESQRTHTAPWCLMRKF